MAMVLTVRQSPITWVSVEADAETQDQLGEIRP